MNQHGRSRRPLSTLAATVGGALALMNPTASFAGEADLVLPDLTTTKFLGGFLTGYTLLLLGLLICAGGLVFGLVFYRQLKNLPVHRTMHDVSELIYATCKTYLLTQGKFILLLWVFIAAVIVAYFGFLSTGSVEGGDGPAISRTAKVGVILLFSLIGIAGSYAVAWFGIRINTFANGRTCMASLRGSQYLCSSIPLKAGMSIGMVLISVELLIMLCILLFIPRTLAGPCFIGFAIGESLGAAALRVAGGIFTKIADIGADLMKIVFKVKEDDARNPGVIADCVGDNAGDSIGPTADGFETYGVTGVALITFIMLAVASPQVQSDLLVWIFAMRILMVVASGAAYFINESISRKKYEAGAAFDYEEPLTRLVWLTSAISIAGTYLASLLLVYGVGGDGHLWWKLATIITCGTLAGALIPEVTKFFTSTSSAHVREVVTASREGGASLNVLSGLTAGNFSAFWVGGVVIVLLMAGAYGVSLAFPSNLMIAPAVFAFGLVAFGFLGMGPVTIAVDSYGPVTDNAQSVFELSLIEQEPGISQELKRDYNFDVDFEKAKLLLEENDGAGNTFKATAKPVLIGTAVVGATTMIFSIVVLLTGLKDPTSGRFTELDMTKVAYLSILHAPFLLGMLAGTATIYWFTGASTQAVITGAYRAVAFIKRHMKLDGQVKASLEDSKRVVEICTQYAQAGMFNIFLTVFFLTLGAAFIEPFFFVGFLIGLAISGLFQAVFMANAGGAWDNAKKIVETELREKGTDLHAATVVGDTVGDPFKDTSSVAMNPIIKFSTLFGLLAVELALELPPLLKVLLSVLFFGIALFFVHRSFYGMRIGVGEPAAKADEEVKELAAIS
ncbi:sodium-translocating pyrophosphatase [Tundrisphaera lichenicola]|uniref:sodium-translocating pyrophosphatase n=1 Tax=Tundrisphaera lichenicola TaxID=2029860 RepID=UPI003EC0EC1E